jgi:hypothetical protein
MGGQDWCHINTDHPVIMLTPSGQDLVVSRTDNITTSKQERQENRKIKSKNNFTKIVLHITDCTAHNSPQQPHSQHLSITEYFLKSNYIPTKRNTNNAKKQPLQTSSNKQIPETNEKDRN